MKTLKEIAKQVRKDLKAELPGYKFSVVTKYASMCQELLVAVMRAPETLFANLDMTTGQTHDGAYKQLNQFQLRNLYDWEKDAIYINNGCYLTDMAADVLKRVDEICNKENYKCGGDGPSYYFSLSIGRHDRPFTVKEL